MRISFRILATSVLVIVCTILATTASVFRCLDGTCMCDTDEEVISCHNNASRTQLPLPPKRLRGYIVLGITNNNLRTLPDESILKQKFPDLQGIDVFGNPNFNCDEIAQYTQIHILSACDNETRLGYPTIEVFMPTEDQTVDDCDLQCQIIKHGNSAKQYMHEIWVVFIEKIKQLREHEFVKEVESGVTGVAEGLMQWLRDHT